jgi:hypothetical protein
MRAKSAAQLIEEGDIFFFYRPKVDAAAVRGRGDVQRFFLALAPKRPKKLYRLFVLGRKKLPEVTGARYYERRNWALNVLTTADVNELRRALLAVEYPTETRGERHTGAAVPVGEGRYQLLKHKDHTELAYALELPKEPGPAQEDFEIRAEASYIVAVKNPAQTAPGLPAPSEPPAYPKRLAARFGSRRWIDADDPALLDYEHSQLLLLGAHAGDVAEELGVTLETEDESLHSAEICRELKLACEKERVAPLLTGELPKKTARWEEKRPGGEEVRRLTEAESPSKAGKIGGAAAAKRAPSAAAITKLLAGIDFPKSKKEISAYAKRHRDRLDDPEAALEVIGELPEREYKTMAEVTRGLGEIR